MKKRPSGRPAGFPDPDAGGQYPRPNGSFAARIRWQAALDPAWEMETHHAGFESAEDAALFANGIDTRSVAGLSLERGALRLRLTDGRSEVIDPSTVTVWELNRPIASDPIAVDANFRQAPSGLHALRDGHLDGSFAPLAYAVLGPNSEPIDVKLTMDDDFGLLSIETASANADAPDTAPSLLFGIIPRA